MSTAKNPAVTPPKGKRARTRQMLIETAAVLIREKGYSNVSMEDVAAKAGVSRGSIYGNFRDRNDLFVAVATSRMPRIAPAPMPGATLREQMRAMGKAVAQAARENRGNTVYWTAYMLHVLSDKELLRRSELQGREMRKWIAAEWAKTLPVHELTMPLEVLVKIATTLTTSLIMAHSMAPDDFDEDVFVTAFEALAGGGVAQGIPEKPKRAR